MASFTHLLLLLVSLSAAQCMIKSSKEEFKKRRRSITKSNLFGKQKNKTEDSPISTSTKGWTPGIILDTTDQPSLYSKLPLGEDTEWAKKLRFKASLSLTFHFAEELV